MRKYLAWESILDEQEALDLSPHQVKQAETQRAALSAADQLRADVDALDATNAQIAARNQRIGSVHCVLRFGPVGPL